MKKLRGDIAFDLFTGILMFTVSVLSIPEIMEIATKTHRSFGDAILLILGCGIFCASFSMIIRASVLSAYGVIQHAEDEDARP